MLFRIPRRYIHTVEMLNLTNPLDLGFDQYVPNYEEVGIVDCWLGVDPTGGRLTMYVPEPVEAENPFFINPRNQVGRLLGRGDYLYRLDTPVPEVDAYGNVNGFSYVTVESKNG